MGSNPTASANQKNPFGFFFCGSLSVFNLGFLLAMIFSYDIMKPYPKIFQVKAMKTDLPLVLNIIDTSASVGPDVEYFLEVVKDMMEMGSLPWSQTPEHIFLTTMEYNPKKNTHDFFDAENISSIKRESFGGGSDMDSELKLITSEFVKAKGQPKAVLIYSDLWDNVPNIKSLNLNPDTEVFFIPSSQTPQLQIEKFNAELDVATVLDAHAFFQMMSSRKEKEVLIQSTPNPSSPDLKSIPRL